MCFSEDMKENIYNFLRPTSTKTAHNIGGTQYNHNSCRSNRHLFYLIIFFLFKLAVVQYPRSGLCTMIFSEDYKEHIYDF